MDDIRWFTPNRYATLPVPGLRAAGLKIATSGDAPARLVVATDGATAINARRYAWKHRRPTLIYLWDVPWWHLDGGKPNRIIPFRGRLVKLPRFGSKYPVRNGYYSRIRYAVRDAFAVWAPSSQSRDEIHRLFGPEPDRVPFCYDSDRFNRAVGWQRPIGSTPVVLTISRLVEYKNQAAVIRAAALLSPSPRVHIIGRGPEARNLRALGAALKVEVHVEESWQSDDQIVAAYLGASVVVCPSRFEGIGLTPLEGAALGIPTIASDIPTHREFAEGQVELMPLDDDATMAAAIGRGLEFRGTPAREPRDPFPDMTIEACVARFLPRLHDLLRGV